MGEERAGKGRKGLHFIRPNHTQVGELVTSPEKPL